MMNVERQAPSLVDLCVNLAIGNLRHIGDVGETDDVLLERILPHCTVDQLMHIEKSTKGRDLTPVTNKLWKKKFEYTFGDECANTVVQRMKMKKVSCPWMELYEAKAREREEKVEKSINRISNLFQKQIAEKKSRQVKLCTKVPPSSRRINFGGNPIPYNGKSNLMRKSVRDLHNSREVQNRAAMKKMSAQRNQSVSATVKPSGVSGRNFASTSKVMKPFERRF